MGRFHTAAEFYHFREPYPPGFFKKLADQLHFTSETRLLDVACGPGNLAIGFAPYVGNIVAIDIEDEMLRVARERAGTTAIQFRQVPIEDFDAGAGTFDVVTIGRALHWLPRQPTLAVLDRVLASGGCIAICHATANEEDSNEWAKKFRDLRRAWSGDPTEAFYRPDLAEWFAHSRFRKVGEIAVEQEYQWTIDELIGRALSFSVTSPSVLGDRRPQFETEVRSVLAPFLHDELLTEKIAAIAVLLQ